MHTTNGTSVINFSLGKGVIPRILCILSYALYHCTVPVSYTHLIVPQGIKKYHPGVAIGINSGEVISGNIGSAEIKRLDYTVVGDVVNTAKRLQSIARENEIIIPEACYEKVKHSFNLQRVGDVVLKNKAKPIAAYKVLS